MALVVDAGASETFDEEAPIHGFFKDSDITPYSHFQNFGENRTEFD